MEFIGESPGLTGSDYTDYIVGSQARETQVQFMHCEINTEILILISIRSTDILGWSIFMVLVELLLYHPREEFNIQSSYKYKRLRTRRNCCFSPSALNKLCIEHPPKYVLTAAHCVWFKKKGRLSDL